VQHAYFPRLTNEITVLSSGVFVAAAVAETPYYRKGQTRFIKKKQKQNNNKNKQTKQQKNACAKDITYAETKNIISPFYRCCKIYA